MIDPRQMNNHELSELLRYVTQVYDERVEELTDKLEVGDLISKPGNKGTIYYLVLDINTTRIKYAVYFVENDGEIHFRDIHVYDLYEVYKVFGLLDDNLIILKGRLEDGEYEEIMHNTMVQLLKRSKEW